MNPGDALETLLADAEILRVENQDYILAPVSSALLDSLATIGVFTEDQEIDDPPEDDDPAEDSDPPENESDEEAVKYHPTPWDRQNFAAVRERMYESQGNVYLTIDPGSGIRLRWPTPDDARAAVARDGHLPGWK